MSEKRYGKKHIILTAVIAAAVTLVLVVGGGFLLVSGLLGRDGMAVLEGAVLINRKFVGEYTRKDMADSALAGMVSGLGDRWSYYMTEEEYAQLVKRRANQYTGIGLTYTAREDGTMEVVSVVADAPADKAGIGPGDVIVAIAGTDLTPDNRSALVSMLAGERGTQVEMTLRDAAGTRRTVTVTLDIIDSDPVAYAMLDGDIGYVQISNFYNRSAQGVREAVDDLVSMGARGLVLDVRNDPGGYVSELTAMLDYLLPEGLIFTEHTKNGPVEVVTSDADCVDLPMVVLMNGDSYSAAELFAAQLRESVGAPLVGTETCGKGYYQQAFTLPNGGAINISTGMYGTGAGESLRGVGLTPDVRLEDPEDQLEAALELVRQAMEADHG